MDEITQSTEQGTASLSFTTKLIRVFTDPATVFENVRLQPDWLLPLLITLVISVGFSLVTQDLMLDFQKEAIYENSLIPEELKDTAIEQMENKSPMRLNIESIGGSVINIFVVYLIAAGAFLVVGNFILGGKASFKQLFSLVSWTGLIGGLELLVKLPLALSKGSLHVYTSLALLMDLSQKKTPLFMILDAIDIFTIWKIVLWSMGMSIIYQFSKAKGYTAIVSLYAVYLLIVIGISQLV